MLQIQPPFTFEDITQSITFVLWSFLIIFVSSHIFCRLFCSKTPLKLRQNSYVVITGGCMGLGKEMTKQIAKNYHCNILIVDIRKDLFDSIQEEIVKFGAICQFYYCDLANDQSVNDFILFLRQRNQQISFFIHNAGIVIPKNALQMSQKELYLQHKVNFLTPVKMIKQTFKLMQKSGQIAVVSSIVALAHGGIQMSGYSSSKSALYSFVNCFRQQLKISKSSINISMGCPYLIKTQMFEGFRTRLDFLFRKLDSQYTAKRLINQFIERKEICYIYEYQSLLFRVISLFPTWILDQLSIKMNISNFQSIRNRHSQRMEKKKK